MNLGYTRSTACLEPRGEEVRVDVDVDELEANENEELEKITLMTPSALQ